MKKSQLKFLVKEIVQQTIQEISQTYLGVEKVELDGDVVDLWGMVLPDNRTVTVSVDINGGGILRVVDDKTNKIIPPDKAIIAATSAAIRDHSDEITNKRSM